jgi:two-component system OmpR family sensor kinase
MSMPRRIGELAARTPLRIKLVATVLVLAAAGLSVAAVAATTSLHSYLLGRVDDQLRSAAGPITNGYGRFSGFGPGSGFGGGPGNGPTSPDGSGITTDGSATGGGGRAARSSQPPSQFYIEGFTDTGAEVGALPQFGHPTSPPKLPRLTIARATTLAGRPFTVGSVKGGSSWRVLIRQLPGGGTVAIATSLSDVSHTVNHLVLLEVLIGGAVLILMGTGGYLLIRRSLRPLVAVEHTAAAIAAGDLSQRVPELPATTEVGGLSIALNGMLAQIEDAFGKERESQQQARASEQRMRRFVADASHELRTPLTSIRGFAELHRMGAAADTGEVRRMMQRIEDEASRMGVLVEDLLLLARLDQQRPLDRAPVDLLDIVRDIVRDAQVIAPQRSIDLQVHADLPPVVSGDEARLRQVFSNLMGNALTHTPSETPVTVTVRTDATEPVVVVEVTDAGPGLSTEDAARVFERFYRADPARNRNAGGTGLGLSIVAGLVAAHGGTVSVASEPGEGTAFRVELPLAEADAATAAT